MSKQSFYSLTSLLFFLFMGCEKPEPAAPVQPEAPVMAVQPPEEMKILQGNNQVGGYNRELSDTIIIRIKPKNTSDLSRYGYSFAGSNAVGQLLWRAPEIKDGVVYVKAVWRTGSQPLRQEIKFYLLADCREPFDRAACKRIDSLDVSAAIREPWSSVYSGTATLEDIHFTTENDALVVSNFSSGIVRTGDGGKTWTSTPAFRSDLYQLCFLNSTTGFVTVSNNYAYFTYDGGASFVSESWTPPIIGHLSSTDFYMVNRHVIYSVGSRGTIVKSTDGGKSWQRYHGFSFMNGLKAITCLDENTCYACGDVAKVVKTSNGGKDWQEYELLLNNNLNTLYFLDQDYGFAGGQYGALIRTTNGGQTWDIIKTKLKTSIISIRFFDRQHGLLVSTGGEIAETTDGGSTWKQLCTYNYGVNDLKKACIKDAKTIFAIQRNSIFKYDLAQ